jgi:hypothetical protein
MPATPNAAILPDTATRDEQRQVDTTIVAELVAMFPGSTSRELAEFSGRDRWQIARRLPEAARLKKSRAVYKGRPRACQVTGRMALTWWPRPVPTAVADLPTAA